VSSEGICHNPLVAGESGFQAQNFQANLKYLDSSHADHPNSIHITVEVPHEDGLLPLVSTTQINNIGNLIFQNSTFHHLLRFSSARSTFPPTACLLEHAYA